VRKKTASDAIDAGGSAPTAFDYRGATRLAGNRLPGACSTGWAQALAGRCWLRSTPETFGNVTSAFGVPVVEASLRHSGTGAAPRAQLVAPPIDGAVARRSRRMNQPVDI
jgi:hypothetical protein